MTIIVTIVFFVAGLMANRFIDLYIRRSFTGRFNSLNAVYTVMALLPILFAACGHIYMYQDITKAIILCLFFIVLAIVTLSDIYTLTVADRMHLCIALLAVVNTILNMEDVLLYLSGFFIISVPMLVVANFTGGFGGADIKLMAVSGLLIGARLIAVAFFIAVILMGSIGIVLIIRKLIFKTPYKRQMPFCPALALGCAVAVFFGNNIIDQYSMIVLNTV